MKMLDNLPDGVTDRDAARYFTRAWYAVWVVTASAALTWVDSWWWILAVLASWAATSGTSYARGYCTARAEGDGSADQ